jgi:hypothetical protein
MELLRTLKELEFLGVLFVFSARIDEIRLEKDLDVCFAVICKRRHIKSGQDTIKYLAIGTDYQMT